MIPDKSGPVNSRENYSTVKDVATHTRNEVMVTPGRVFERPTERSQTLGREFADSLPFARVCNSLGTVIILIPIRQAHGRTVETSRVESQVGTLVIGVIALGVP